MNRQRIFVKHFENPESFLFTQYDAHLAKVEEQLNQRSETSPLSQISLNKVADGEFVAIYYKPWQKYIISNIVVNSNSAWLINYGFHVKLLNNLVYKVPKDVEPCSCFVQRGGISYISSSSRTVDQWATEICKKTCNIIKNAAKIYFIKLYTNTDDHHWGELKVHMRNGKEIDVGEYLVENGHAVRSYEYHESQTIRSQKNEHGNIKLDHSSVPIELRTDDIHDNKLEQQDCLPANERFGFSALPEFQKENPCTHTGICQYPAGFDIARLHKYNDQNHWHIRKSTRTLDDKPAYIRKRESSKKWNEEYLMVQTNDECIKVKQTNNTPNIVSVNASSSYLPEYVPRSIWEPMPRKPEATDFEMFSPKRCVGRGTLIGQLVNMAKQKKKPLVTSVNNSVSEGTATLMRSNESVGMGRGSLLASLRNLCKNNSVACAEDTKRLPCLVPKRREEQLMNDAEETDINKSIQTSKTVSKPHADLHLQSNLLGSLVVAHSAIPLRQCISLGAVGFKTSIIYTMRSMYFDKLYYIQSYAWPHSFRRNSLVVISGPKSGKTWCYLPTICNLLISHIPERQRQQRHGPSAIILVATQGHVKHTALACQRLLHQFDKINWETVVAYFDQRDASQMLTNLINGCGILITTPRLFLSLVEEHKKLDCLFNIDVLNHIVLDDLDQMLTYSKERCMKLIATLFRLFKSGDKLNVPLILTSRQWISGLMLKMMQLINNPLLLIGDFVEAAAYGKIKMFVKICEQHEKIARVVSQIDTIDNYDRIVVIVSNNNEDIRELNAAFRTRGILTIDYTQNADRDTRTILPARWKSERQQIVLVCTDADLAEIRITNAHIIVHFSMPNTWEKFTRRFNLITGSIPNYVATNFDPSITNTCASLQTMIYLDKHSSHNMPHLMEFLQLHNVNISQPTKNSLIELHRHHEEEWTTRKQIPLCTYLLGGSSCSNPLCMQRHQLEPNDLINESSVISCDDVISIQVLEVYSPTHLAAQLLKHKPPNDKWKTLPYLYAKISMGLDIYYSDPKNRKHHWPQRVNDICVIKTQNHYARVRLINMTPCENDRTGQLCDVIAKMLDRGTQLLQLKSSELFVCADKFRKETATAIDIRLTGIVANNDEHQWCDEAIEATKNWLNQKANNCAIHAAIDCMLKETVFVKNIIVMEYLPTISTYVYKVNLKVSLKKNGFATDQVGICEIKQLLKSMQEQNLEAAKVRTQKTTCAENVNAKISDQKQQLESGSGNVDLGLDVNSNEKDKIQAVQNKSDEYAKAQTNNIVYSCLEKAGFECMAEARWTTLPLRIPTRVEIGDERYNGKWDHLYLQRIEPKDLVAFDQLSELISKHISELKNNPKPVDELSLKINQDCIIKFDDQYLRARVCGISRSGNDNCYRFFLVDYACFAKALSHHLADDFLYKTSREIVHFTPFQAVHCTLAGIKLKTSVTKAYKVSWSYLYAYTLAEHKTVLFNGCKSYDIVLYECQTPDNLEDVCMVNEKLVEQNVANYDTDTHHFYKSVVSCTKKTNFEKFTTMLKRYQDLDDQAAVEVGYTLFGDIFDTMITQWKTDTEKSTAIAETKKVLPKIETKKQLNDPHVTSRVPQLVVHFKYPQITWHDSAGYVQLQIHAGDTTNYEFSWQADTFFYVAEALNEACSLQLCGLIDTAHVSHELRGLSVIVKMKKQICGKWPRLLKKETKQTSWLKYNIDRYLAEQTGLSEAQQKLRIVCGIEAFDVVKIHDTSEYSDESDEFDGDFTELNDDDDDN